jgi:hypothetical protein
MTTPSGMIVRDGEETGNTAWHYAVRSGTIMCRPGLFEKERSRPQTLVEHNMRSKLLMGVAAPALIALTFLATAEPASAQHWGYRGAGWGAAALAAGVVGGAVAAATSPLWAPGYYGYYDSYYPTYAYGPSFAYAPSYGYDYGYAPSYTYGYTTSYDYGSSYSYGYGSRGYACSEGYSPRYSFGRTYARADRGAMVAARRPHHVFNR